MIGEVDSCESYDAYALQLLGLLWCHGSTLEKAQCLYGLIKKKSDQKDHLAYDDFELKKALRVIVYLASIFTIRSALNS